MPTVHVFHKATRNSGGISDSPSMRARTKSGKHGPPGERNGQYRHGERTKAAIAEQRTFSALLTSSALTRDECVTPRHA